MPEKKCLTTEQKVFILIELLENRTLIKRVAEKIGVHVIDIYNWKKNTLGIQLQLLNPNPHVWIRLRRKRFKLLE